MNTAGPNVCFGFESMPGHQKGPNRGGYSSSADGGGVYGGCGVYAAKIGGLWDAMLSEGRNFWLFASSDCHYNDDDFFPGEYQKTYTNVSDKTDPLSIVAGLKSGNSYVVLGDLIDSLSFNVGTAVMGETLEVTENEVTVTVRVHDPESDNFNTYSDYKNPVLDHIDIIAGICSDKVDPSDTEEYKKDSVETTEIVARFATTAGAIDAANITTQAWTESANGWKEFTFTYPIENSQKLYFRLRGTNQAVNTAGETDEYGNPLLDPLGENTAEKAFDDLWFYSNPIFVENSTVTLAATIPSGNQFVMSPNPSDDNVFVSFSTPQNGYLSIYNINGSMVKKVALNNDTQKTISLNNMTAGTYIVNLNNSISEKLIVK